MLKTRKKDSNLVSALRVRNGFGAMLRRVEEEKCSLVIEKSGTPRAVLLSIRDYVRLASPEPAILKLVGDESKRNGSDKLTSAQIDRIVRVARSQKKKF
jgi:prevent-host-death family protein